MVLGLMLVSVQIFNIANESYFDDFRRKPPIIGSAQLSDLSAFVRATPNWTKSVSVLFFFLPSIRKSQVIRERHFCNFH